MAFIRPFCIKAKSIFLKDSAGYSPKTPIIFECQLNLNGSGSINFIPVGSTTHVEVEGDWKAPGFIGNFSPDYTFTETGFKAVKSCQKNAFIRYSTCW